MYNLFENLQTLISMINSKNINLTKKYKKEHYNCKNKRNIKNVFI